jgi:hypothetical protein
MLRKRDVYRRLPMEVDEPDGRGSLVPWPPMRYLLALAPWQPDAVADTLNEIPPSDNLFVNAAILEVAMALPINKVPVVVPRVSVCLDARYTGGWSGQLGKLTGRLATANEVGAALSLAGAVLALHDPPPEPAAVSELMVSLREPHLRVPDYVYHEFLREQIPALARAAGLPVVELLGDLLEDAIRISSTRAMIDAGEDLSAVWRREIAEQPDVHDVGLKSHLVSALRDATDAVIESGRAGLPEVVELLEARQPSIFRRLAMFLLASSGHADIALIEARLVDRVAFHDEQLRPEHTLLMGASYVRLSDAAQAEILGFIDEGRGTEWLTARTQAFMGREPTADEEMAYVERWQLERLSPIALHLTGEWAERYRRLSETHGAAPPNVPDLRGGPWAPTSPATPEELAALDVDELLAFVAGFEPASDYLGPSGPGLARSLVEVIAASPAKYMPQARRFGDVAPEYACAALEALWRVANASGDVDWAAALDLCEAVVAHSRSSDGEANGLGWRSARFDVIRVLGLGLERDQIDPGTRRRVFAVIRVLVGDPDPTPADEAADGLAITSPGQLASGTVRPKAIRLAADYAIWVYRREPHDGFAEVLGLIEEHLDPVTDPSVAVRAAIGEQFPNLVAFDPQWAAAHADQIIPAVDDERTLWEAGWDAYLWVGPRNKATYESLRTRYELAVARIAPESSDRRQQSRDRVLAQHLMAIYAGGSLELDGGPVEGFFRAADEAARASSLEWIGRWLTRDGPAPKEEVVERLFALWDRRVEAVRARPSKELSAFGRWFCSPHLDVPRRINGLRSALNLSGAVDDAHHVVDELAALAERYPPRGVGAAFVDG